LFVNLFAYDGTGIWLLQLSPAPPRRVALGKQLACALLAAAELGALLCAARLFFAASWAEVALLVPAFTAGLGAALGVGARLSVRFYRPFTMELTRRDRPPAAASAAVLLALGATAFVVGRL
jgi:hypothetical protein